MRRLIFLIGVLALVAASCASDSDTSSTAADSQAPVTTSPVTTTPVTTSPVTTSPTSKEPTTTVPVVEGPAAPDFTLALGDGGEFTLSAEEKPVYLIFWAEW